MRDYGLDASTVKPDPGMELRARIAEMVKDAESRRHDLQDEIAISKGRLCGLEHDLRLLDGVVEGLMVAQKRDAEATNGPASQLDKY